MLSPFKVFTNCEAQQFYGWHNVNAFVVDKNGRERSTRFRKFHTKFITLRVPLIVNRQTAILSQSHPHNFVKDLGRPWGMIQTWWCCLRIPQGINTRHF